VPMCTRYGASMRGLGPGLGSLHDCGLSLGFAFALYLGAALYAGAALLALGLHRRTRTPALPGLA